MIISQDRITVLFGGGTVGVGAHKDKPTLTIGVVEKHDIGASLPKGTGPDPRFPIINMIFTDERSIDVVERELAAVRETLRAAKRVNPELDGCGA